jgi:membrane-associated protein
MAMTVIGRLEGMNWWDLHSVGSWAYLVILAMVIVDGMFPVIPSETSIIAGGAIAASGHLSLVLVVLVTWFGVMTGDLITHELTRRGRSSQLSRWSRRRKPRQALDWAAGLLQRRGALVVFGGRFVPLGRTATSLVTGFTVMPRRRYLPPLAAGALLWSGYIVSLGYFGGQFVSNPLVSVGIGVGVSLTIGAISAGVGRIRARRSAASVTPLNAASPATVTDRKELMLAGV